MKKAQILSAIALALALGVVIPAAGASVSVYALNATEEADTKAINEKLNQLYNGLGTIIIYNPDKTQIQLTGVDAYTWYTTYNNNIVAAQNAISIAENATVSTASSAAAQLRSAVTAVLDADNDSHIDADVMNASSTMGDLFNSVWSTTGTFDDIKGIATEIRDMLNAKISSLILSNVAADQAYRNRLEAYRDNLNSVLGRANTILSDAITTATSSTRGVISSAYAQLTGDYAVSISNEAELNSAIATMEGKLPQLAYFRRVYQSVQNLTTMKNGINNYSHRQVEAELETADKAMAGTITSATPVETPSDTTLKPGNTGLVGSAEGTATTVSIVAGLATALTALGAGVVVYRNARREK